MTMTARRLRRPAYGLLTKQSAKGTPATVFTLGADSIRIWSYQLPTEPGRDKSRPGPWMSQSETEESEARFNLAEKSEGRIIALATPEAVKMFFRSNWGTHPTVDDFVLRKQPGEWFTIAWVEDKTGGSAQNLIRLQDVFIHRVELRVDRTDGRLVLIGDYAARRTPVTPLDDLGGIVLPANPVAVADTRVYNIRNIEFRRDPDGDNVDMPFEELSIVFDQKVVSEWTKSNKWEVYKGGKTLVSIALAGMLSDETWKLLDDNITNIREKFRFSADAPATVDHPGASDLTITFPEVDFEVEKVGHDAKSYIDFRAKGRAHRSGTDDFVSISIT